LLNFEMITNPPPELTGGRLERFMAVVRNAPRDPSCGCVKLGETAMLLIEAIFAEQRTVDIEMEKKDGEGTGICNK
jgi:hypothetical protein